MKARIAVLLVPALLVPLGSQVSLPSAADADPRCHVPSSGAIRAKELPRHWNAVACRAVGRVLDLGKARITIPGAGEQASMNRLFADGSDTTTVEVSESGEVTYSYLDQTGDDASGEAPVEIGPEDDVEVVQPPDAATAEDPESSLPTSGLASVSNTCGTNYEYKLLNTKIYSARTYWIGDGSIPGAGTFSQWQAAVAAGAKTWVTENSPCYSSDGSSVPALNYGGLVVVESNIVNSGGQTTCGTSDGSSIIDAGNLDYSRGSLPLAVTCRWTTAHAGMDNTPTFDIKFNTTDFDFTYDPTSSSCNYKFDVISVITHELGHALGLGDLSSAASTYQTMHESIKDCHYYPRTLHNGDVHGIRAIY